MTVFNRIATGLVALALLASTCLWSPASDAAPKKPKTSDKSDLNYDGLVNYDDLVIFSTDYLGMDADSISWCAFYDATGGTDLVYDREPDFYTRHFNELLDYINNSMCQLSDLNGDRIINARDLKDFSEKYIGEHFLKVDWCEFLEAVLQGDSLYGHPVDYYLNHYGELMLYIQDKNTCTDEPPPPTDLALKNSPRFLTRIAAANDLSGNYYVTDAKVGSVFIFNANLEPTAELKGLATPLGIAVNADGHILVGNDKRNNVEVYNPATGELISTFGQAELETPSSIMIDSQGNIYVSDSGSNTIYVYDSSYQLLKNIGERGREAHQLRGPSNALLSPDETELFVLDRLNKRVQVFDIEGNWLRSVTFEGTPGTNCSWFTGKCEIPGAPEFTRVQSMAFDTTGRLHVVDIFHAAITMFDPQTGEYLGIYGAYGEAQGELKSPSSILPEVNRILVVDGGKNTIEALAIP
jgi:DNA-binding beta-propeller fold protein YncE